MRTKGPLRLFLAVLLLPVCGILSHLVWRLTLQSSSAWDFWVPFVAGAGCWLSVFCLLPKPVLLYVFGHELTHALAVWLFGGRVSKFRATGRGGYVVATRTNFIISLAPYFFPLYVMLLALLFAGGSLWWDMVRLRSWFHLALGAAYGFHVTMTLHALRLPQSDLLREGVVWSVMVIWLGNVLVLALGIWLISPTASWRAVIAWVQEDARHLLELVLHWIGSAARR